MPRKPKPLLDPSLFEVLIRDRETGELFPSHAALLEARKAREEQAAKNAEREGCIGALTGLLTSQLTGKVAAKSIDIIAESLFEHKAELLLVLTASRNAPPTKKAATKAAPKAVAVAPAKAAPKAAAAPTKKAVPAPTGEVKRGRGRPPGSPNKSSQVVVPAKKASAAQASGKPASAPSSPAAVPVPAMAPPPPSAADFERAAQVPVPTTPPPPPFQSVPPAPPPLPVAANPFPNQ